MIYQRVVLGLWYDGIYSIHSYVAGQKVELKTVHAVASVTGIYNLVTEMNCSTQENSYRDKGRETR